MTYREWLKDRRDENIDPCRAYNSVYNLAVKYMTTLMEPLKAGSFEKGKQVERERIRDIIKAVGVQGNHSEWFDCVDTILERIDD